MSSLQLLGNWSVHASWNYNELSIYLRTFQIAQVIFDAPSCECLYVLGRSMKYDLSNLKCIRMIKYSADHCNSMMHGQNVGIS